MDRRNRRERGSILVMIAVTMTALLGVTALSLDAAYLFDQRNRMAAAADGAALAAAREMNRSASSNLQAFANREVAIQMAGTGVSAVSGSSNVAVCSPPVSTAQVAVCVNTPPLGGMYAGNDKYVEVLVSKSMSIFFARVLGRDAFTVSTRAVAGGEALLPDCAMALNSTNTNPAIDIRAGAAITAANCTISANGNMNTSGSGSITVAPSGDYNATGTFGGTVAFTPAGAMNPGSSSISNPLTALDSQQPTPGACKTITNPLTEGTYCNGLAGPTKLNYTVTMNPGTYIMLGGGFQVMAGADVTGNGVTIFNTYDASHPPGQIRIAEDSDLHAPLTGPYAGILFWQPSNTTMNAFSADFTAGGSGNHYGGAFYLPGATINFRSGGSSCGATDYIFLIANVLNFTAGANICNNIPPTLNGGAFGAKLSVAE
jgi:Flp pilus assembly protein TadG